MDFAETLRKRLAQHGGAAPAGVDAVVALQTADRASRPLACLVMEGGVARVAENPKRQAVDVTFTFDSAATARGILLGDANPLDAFLAGRFRTDGHLPLVFVVLGLFRGDPRRDHAASAAHA